MSEHFKAPRTWQEIAAELSQEKNPTRLLQLARELELAFAERDKIRSEKADEL